MDRNHSASRRRRLLFSLIPAVVLFGGIEAALRITGFEYSGIPTHFQFGANVTDDLQRHVAIPDARLFWRLHVKPETLRVLVQRRCVHPEIRHLTGADSKSPTALRVVTMGDSCTFFGTPPYSRRVEQMLDARGHDAEVFNAAVPGYTSFQGRRWLTPEIESYQPDWITVYYGWNDHWLAMRQSDRVLGGERSALARGAESVTRRVRIVQAGRYLASRFFRPAPDRRPVRVPLEDYRENLSHLCDRITALGARPILITAPADLDEQDLHRLRRDGFVALDEDVRGLHEEYNRVVREVAEECGAELVDFARASPVDGSGFVSQDGIHLTDRGGSWLATMLAEKIGESGR